MVDFVAHWHRWVGPSLLAALGACDPTADLRGVRPVDNVGDAGGMAGAENVVHVAPSGSDSNVGSQTAPMRTIQAAVRSLEARRVGAAEVRVCAGVGADGKAYDEPQGVTLNARVTLRGNYECVTWTMSPSHSALATRGRHGFLLTPQAGGTRIEGFDLTHTADSVTDLSAAIDLEGTESAAVEGVTLAKLRIVAGGSALIMRGAYLLYANGTVLDDVDLSASNPNVVEGIRVAGGAGTTVRGGRIAVQGGRTDPATGAGAVGIAVTGSARTSIESVAIDVNRGAARGGLSNGLRLNGGEGHVVRGGTITVENAVSAPDREAAVGVQLSDTTSAVLEDLTIRIVGGEGGGTAAHPAYGVLIGGGAKTTRVSNSLIHLQGGKCTTPGIASCEPRGISDLGEGGTVLARNRIHLEPSGTFDAAWAPQAVVLGSGGTVRDNMMLVGEPRLAGGATPAGGLAISVSTRSVWRDGPPPTTVVGNTIVTPSPPVSILVGGAGAATTTLLNNLFVGVGRIALTSCTTTLRDVSANAFVTDTDEVESCSSRQLALSELNALHPSMKPNVRVTSCGNNVAACAPKIFADWDAQWGRPRVTDGRGYRLLDTAPCEIRAGALTTAGFDRDFLDAARTGPWSVGAHENDAACP